MDLSGLTMTPAKGEEDDAEKSTRDSTVGEIAVAGGGELGPAGENSAMLKLDGSTPRTIAELLQHEDVQIPKLFATRRLSKRPGPKTVADAHPHTYTHEHRHAH